jgi:hypothetical protein
MNAAKVEAVARLERVGFVLHTAGAALQEARARFPVKDDLSPRLAAIEEEARILAGEIAMRLRDLDESSLYGAGPA